VKTEISSQDVARQFAKTVELFLDWLETRIQTNDQISEQEPTPDDNKRLMGGITKIV
jgi:hypothetical protein